jgi:D-glycero-D-manno-heptose 1,7-bisphosphate phosphatase
MTAACFVDRDGTVMIDTHYPNDPAAVRLVPGAAAALRRVVARTLPIVVITNQGGIARGLVTPAQYEAVRGRLVELLALEGVPVLATYHCPHWAPVSGPCDCRKPAPGLYQRAAADHALALPASLFVGDRWRDVAPGLALGGLGVLVPGPDTPAADIDAARADAHVVPALDDAVSLFLARLDATVSHAR